MSTYADVSREGLEDMLEEATEEIGILRKRMKEFNLLIEHHSTDHKECEILHTIMPCGHEARYQVQEKDTQYCSLCLNQQSMCSYCGQVCTDKNKTEAIAEHVITCEKRPEKVLIELIEKAVELLEDDRIDAAMALLSLETYKRNKEQL